MSFDEVTPEDIQRLQTYFQNELENLAEHIRKLYSKTKELKTYDARVVGYPTEEQEIVYGPGSVLIDCPELRLGKKSGFYAAQRNRSQQGSFEYPSIDSWISIYRDPSNERFYILGYTFPIPENAPSGEKIGYTGSTTLPLPYRAGEEFDKVRNNKETYRLLNSSDNFIFSEDKDTKELSIKVNTDYKSKLLGEDGTEIKIGSSGVGDKVDVSIETGGTGKVEIKTQQATFLADQNKVTTTISSTKLELTSSKAIIEATDIESKGTWVHDGKMTVKDDIEGEKEVFAKYGGPSQVGLSTHTTPYTDTPIGPATSSPPTPGS